MVVTDAAAVQAQSRDTTKQSSNAASLSKTEMYSDETNEAAKVNFRVLQFHAARMEKVILFGALLVRVQCRTVIELAVVMAEGEIN